MVIRAGIAVEDVIIFDHYANGGIENWIILSKGTIRTIKDNFETPTFIISPHSHEPRYKISIHKDAISIHYQWENKEAKNLEISKIGFLQIHNSLNNYGELVIIESRAHAQADPIGPQSPVCPHCGNDQPVETSICSVCGEEFDWPQAYAEYLLHRDQDSHP